MLAELTEREWDIINQRFNHDKSIYNLADKYKISGQRVKAIEDRIVRNLEIAFDEPVTVKKPGAKKVIINL